MTVGVKTAPSATVCNGIVLPFARMGKGQQEYTLNLRVARARTRRHYKEFAVIGGEIQPPKSMLDCEWLGVDKYQWMRNQKWVSGGWK
jgi:hypothetical protein